MEKIKKISNINKNNTAILIHTSIARRYLTGFFSSLGYLFIANQKAYFFVDGRYIEAAKENVNKFIEVQLLENLGEQIKALLGENISEIFVETKNTVADIKNFEKLLKIKITPNEEIDKILAEFRICKTFFEINSIILAQRIAEKAFDKVLGFIKPGVTELEIAALLEYEMKRMGSEEPSFNTIAITGKKTSMPHGEPGNVKVQNGDFVTMDFGAVCNGYHSDMTRTVAVGKPTEQMKRVYNIVLDANKKVLENLKEGLSTFDADKIARDVIKKSGYGKEFSHSLGHGVGLMIHELPNLSPKSKDILKENQVVTVEPGIYIPGNFGVRIEDMAVILKNGCNNLTKSSKSLIIL